MDTPQTIDERYHFSDLELPIGPVEDYFDENDNYCPPSNRKDKSSSKPSTVKGEDTPKRPRKKRRKKTGAKKKRQPKWWKNEERIIRFVPYLRKTFNLTVAESVLAHILVAYSSMKNGSVRMCGGMAHIPARLVDGAISHNFNRHINEYLESLVKKGVLRSYVGRVGRSIVANVSGRFARAVRQAKMYVKNLFLWKFNWGKDSALYKASPTAKLICYVWNYMTYYTTRDSFKSPARASSRKDAYAADAYPRVALLSRWTGVSPSQVRRVLKKYNGTLWELADVCLEDPCDDPGEASEYLSYRTVCFTDTMPSYMLEAGTYKPYGRAIRTLHNNVYHFIGHEDLIRMVNGMREKLMTNLDVMHRAFGIDWFKQKGEYKQKILDTIELYSGWSTALEDSPAVSYRRFQKRIRERYEWAIHATIELPANPVYDAVG